MKRFLCPNHAHFLRDKTKAIGLSITDCSVCRWENRPWTLADFATELENVAASMRFAHNDPDYDPHGITFLTDFERVVEQWIKHISPSYAKNFIDSLTSAFGASQTLPK